MVERGVIGVDLGGTKLLAGAIDADLAVHHRTNRPVVGLDQHGLVQMVTDAVEEIRTAVGDGIEAVGFGIPCTFDTRTGEAVQAVNLPLRDVRFHEVMASRLGLPVVVDNDANCAVFAEARAGAAAGCSEVVLLTLGTGIGGGLYVGGEVYRGWLGGGAELGHMVVIADGPPCQGTCPGRGCLEAVASGTALVREASLAVARRPDTALGQALESGKELTGPLITSLAREGDPVARAAIARIGHWLGVGIVSLVNIFNPQVVVVGGGVSAAGELLLEPAREVVARHALAPNRDVVEIVSAGLGPEAGMIGAGLMARERGGVLQAGFPGPPSSGAPTSGIDGGGESSPPPPPGPSSAAGEARTSGIEGGAGEGGDPSGPPAGPGLSPPPARPGERS